jgi:hypothetical protein
MRILRLKRSLCGTGELRDLFHQISSTAPVYFVKVHGHYLTMLTPYRHERCQ